MFGKILKLLLQSTYNKKKKEKFMFLLSQMCKDLKKKICKSCQLNKWVVMTKHLKHTLKRWQYFLAQLGSKTHSTDSVVSNKLSCLGLAVQLIIVFFAYSCKTEVWKTLQWVNHFRYSGLSKKDVLHKKGDLFLLAVIFIIVKGNRDGHQNQSMGMALHKSKCQLMHFVIISVLVLHRLS